MSKKIEINVTETANAISSAADRALRLSNELNEIAKNMIAEKDIGAASMAVEAIMNAMSNFRLDLMITRPIREFQTQIAIVESKPAPAEDHKFAGKTKLQILHDFGYAVFPEDGGFSATIVADTEAFYARCDTLKGATDEAYSFLLGEVDPALHTLPTFDTAS